MMADRFGGIPIGAAQWAMHPRYFEAHMRRFEVLGGLMPLALAGAGGRAKSSALASPVREGKILVVPISGMLAPRGIFDGGTAYEDIADRVYEAGADSEVSAIILAIRSPGGTVWGCAEAGDAIYATRSLKPIVAIASPYCFSAAYWLATQAGSFYATKSGEVGSVGVRTSHTDMSGFERKVGIRTTLIGSSRDKIAAHQYAPLSDEDRADLQGRIDETNAIFIRAIARGRRMLARDVAKVHGSGGTFSAQRAISNGAIDGIATLRDLISRQSSTRGRLDLMRRQAAALELMTQI